MPKITGATLFLGDRLKGCVVGGVEGSGRASVSAVDSGWGSPISGSSCVGAVGSSDVDGSTGDGESDEGEARSKASTAETAETAESGGFELSSRGSMTIGTSSAGMESKVIRSCCGKGSLGTGSSTSICESVACGGVGLGEAGGISGGAEVSSAGTSRTLSFASASVNSGGNVSCSDSFGRGLGGGDGLSMARDILRARADVGSVEGGH